MAREGLEQVLDTRLLEDGALATEIIEGESGEGESAATEETTTTDPVATDASGSVSAEPTSVETTLESSIDGTLTTEEVATTSIVEEGSAEGSAPLTDEELMATTAIVEEGSEASTEELTDPALMDGGEVQMTATATETASTPPTTPTMTEVEDVVATTDVTEGEMTTTDATAEMTGGMTGGEDDGMDDDMDNDMDNTDAEMTGGDDDDMDDDMDDGMEVDDDIEGGTGEDEMTAAIEEVEGSELFDAEVYLEENPDVAAAVQRGETTAIKHFFQYGRFELRTFSAYFSNIAYLQQNTDVAAQVQAGQTNIFDHFWQFGRQEGREFSSFFSVSAYLEKNSDVAEAVARGETTAVDHFLKHGRKEGRECSNLFSVKAYLEMNPDVAEAVARGETNACDHFAKFGKKEKREFSKFFNIKAYLEQNPDVAAAVERGETTAVDHFWQFGRFESREISFSFSISQITSIFSVTSFSQISLSELSAFFSSSEGEELLLGGSGEDDLTEGAGGETTAGAGGETTTTETTTETTTTTGEEPQQVQIPDIAGNVPPVLPTPEPSPEPAIPAPSASLDISFIVETYKEQLQAQFPDFDFENLTAAQAQQIQQYAEAEQLNPSPFVDASFVSSTVSVRLQSLGINITGLSQQQIIDRGLEEGISPCPTIDLSFVRKSYADQLLKFFKVESLEQISNQELFEFIGGEGLKLGLNTSAFFNLKTYRETFSAEIIEFFGVASIEEVTNQQIFQFANGEGLEKGLNPSQFVRLNFYKAVYAEQLKEFFSVESLDEITNVQLIGFISTTGIEQGLNPSPGIGFNYIKAVYGEEVTAALGENPSFQDILNFISTEGLELGLNPSVFVNLGYSEKLYREDIRAAKDIFGKGTGGDTLKKIKDLSEEEINAGVAKLSDAQVLESLVVDDAPMVDVKFYRWQYGEELKTFYGLATVEEVADLSEEQIISFACGEGQDMGLSLSPFDGEGYLAVEENAQALIEFYGVADVADLSPQQIYEFAVGEGITMGLSVATFVSIEYYSVTYEAALTATFGAEYTDEQVIDFVFGNAKPFVDVKYYIEANAEAVEALAMSLGKEVTALTDEEIITYALTEGFDAEAKLSALDIDAYITAHSAELVAFYEVEDATKLSQEQVYKFMLGEGWKLGIGLAEFVAEEDVQFYRELNAEALTELYGVEDVALLSAEVVLDYQFGGLSGLIDYDYLRFSMSEELLAFYADAGVTDVADLTNLQILDFTYSELFVSEEFSVGMLSAVDMEGYLAAGGAELEQALKEYFEVEDVASVDQKDIQEFMLTVGVEMGFAVEGFVDVEYIRETYGAAIATPEAVAEWSSTTTVDIGYVRYQINKLIEAGTITLETLKAESLVGEDVEDLANLSDAEICGLAKNADFTALLGEGVSIELSVSENIEYLRETYSAAIAYARNITLEEVAAIGDEEILAWASDSGADVGFIRYQVVQALEQQYVTLDQVKTYLGVEIEDISDLTDVQIVELAFNSEFIGSLPEGQGVMPGVVDTAGFLAVEENATALKAFFEVEDVSTLTQAQVREFMFGAAMEQGLSLEGFVKFEYLQSTYFSAIIDSDQKVFDWLAKGEIDVEFLRYEIKQLEPDQLTTLLGELNIEVTDVDMLDSKQVINIAYSGKFKELFEGKKLQLGAIDFDGYREKYAVELADYFATKGTGGTGGTGGSGGSGSGGDDLEGGSGGDDLEGGSGGDDLEGGSGGDDLEGGTGSGGMEGGTGGDDLEGDDDLEGGEDFDVASIKDKDLAKFMFGKGWKMGLNPLEFVSVDFLRDEFAGKIAKHYKIEREAVVELKDELIIGGVFGGLGDEIDIDFCRKANKDKLTAKFGKPIEQITEVEILEYAYTDGLTEGVALSEADLVDVEGYLGEYGDEVAAELGVEVDKVAELDVSKILEFALGKGLKIGLDLAAFADVDSFRQNFAADIAFNYRFEQVYNLTAESTFSYMLAGGLDAGLDASPAINLEWYRTNYAAELETDKATIDLDGNGELDNSELYDYVTGVGLEKGLNPSDLIDFEAYRAEGSASAQDLLTFYNATSLEEVSYTATLEYMLSAGLEAGHMPSEKVDLEAYIAANSDKLMAEYGVESIEEISKVEAFTSFALGLETETQPAPIA